MSKSCQHLRSVYRWETPCRHFLSSSLCQAGDVDSLEEQTGEHSLCFHWLILDNWMLIDGEMNKMKMVEDSLKRAIGFSSTNISLTSSFRKDPKNWLEIKIFENQNQKKSHVFADFNSTRLFWCTIALACFFKKLFLVFNIRIINDNLGFI